jgi:hypothetical protein
MKPITRILRNGTTLFALAFLFAIPARSTVPIPDVVIYGTIAIQNRAVTNNTAGTNVVIEAHRTSDNQLLASYQMGSSTSQGKLFYALRVPMEDAPASSSSLAEPNDALTLIVKKVNAVQFTTNNIPATSGTALRVDFGASVDADGNGVPDGWETANLGTSGGDLSLDTDHDGISDLAEYILGTSPTDSNDVFRLYSTNLISSRQMQITFNTKSAQGAGYEGRTRYYALETTTNFVAGPWNTVTNYSRIMGSNQSVNYTNGFNPSAPAWFRARVWLEGP